jgi:hypothetical protein
MPRPLTAESIKASDIIFQKPRQQGGSRGADTDDRCSLRSTHRDPDSRWLVEARYPAQRDGEAQSTGSGHKSVASTSPTGDRLIEHHAQEMIERGRQTFRYDTFGSEAFWGDKLQLHKAIAGEKHGGVGVV